MDWSAEATLLITTWLGSTWAASASVLMKAVCTPPSSCRNELTVLLTVTTAWMTLW